MKLFLVTLLVAGLAFLPSSSMAKDSLKIHVSILPQKYIVERITKEHAIVDVLVTPGKSPGTYSPTPNQIKKLAESDIYFRIGVPFENGFMHKIKSIADKIQIVDTRQGIQLRDMKIHQDHQTVSGHHEKKYLGKDPHIWMSPVLVKQQAHTILNTLIRMDPANRSVYELNYESLKNDLDHLHTQMALILKDLEGENLFVFHPSFGYFTDTYGMNQVAVESMGRAPKGKELSQIIKLAKNTKTRVIFVQPQFDRHAAQKIASAIEGAVVSINPLAYDYLANMNNMAQAIASSLKQ